MQWSARREVTTHAPLIPSPPTTPSPTMVLTPSAGKKRKNDENIPAAAPPKKARTLKDGAHSAVAVLVDTILANPKACVVPSGEEAVRSVLVDIALYARALEQQEPALPTAIANPAASSTATTSAAVVATAKSPEQLKAEAETIRRTAQAGIVKQMGVSAASHICTHTIIRPDAHTSSGNLRATLGERSGATTVSAPTPRSSACSWGSADRPSSASRRSRLTNSQSSWGVLKAP